MNFSFSEDQLAFRDAVKSLLSNKCTIDHVRDAWTNETGRVAGLWQALAEQGLTLLTLPENNGGLGLGELDTVLIFEEAGRACLPEPLIELVAVATPLLVDLAGRGNARAAELLEKTACGTIVLPVLDGTGYALYADAADFFLVEENGAIKLYPAADVQRSAEQSVDRTRRLSKLSFDTSKGEVLAEGAVAEELLGTAKDRGALAAAAFLCGLGDSMVQLGVNHTSTRNQFGQPIGSFQAVQHRIVNGWMGIEFARPAVYRAAYSMQNGDEQAEVHVSMAKIFASEGAYKASREILQVHGGIGYTTEYELHMLMKRTWALMKAWGDQRSHEKRVEKALLD